MRLPHWGNRFAFFQRRGWRRFIVILISVGLALALPLFVVSAGVTLAQSPRLTIAVKDNLPPLGFLDPAGQLQGFEIEIAQRLAAELSVPPDRQVLKPVPNQERIAAVLKGEADLAIARVTATASRSRLVVFSFPYYLDGTGLITRDPAIQRVEDIRDRPIAVLGASSTIATLRYRLPTANLVEADSYEAAHTLLEQGQAAAFAADASVLTGWTREFPEYRLLTPLLSVEPLSIVMPKGLQHDALRRRINQLLERWYEAGWLRERATAWGLP